MDNIIMSTSRILAYHDLFTCRAEVNVYHSWIGNKKAETLKHKHTDPDALLPHVCPSSSNEKKKILTLKMIPRYQNKWLTHSYLSREHPNYTLFMLGRSDDIGTPTSNSTVW